MQTGHVTLRIATLWMSLWPGYSIVVIWRRAANSSVWTQSLGVAQPGEPRYAPATQFGDDHARELPSTSHISIVDAQGHALAMTTSIEAAFGSRIMVNGYLLNNQLTDFSFVPTEAGKPVANCIAARKRPRSAMAPTLVFDAAWPICSGRWLARRERDHQLCGTDPGCHAGLAPRPTAGREPAALWQPQWTNGIRARVPSGIFNTPVGSARP